MTYLEAQAALARKLDIDISDISNNGLFSLADLKEWIDFGITRAWDYKRWDFSEGGKTITITAGMIADGYIDYPTDFQMGTIKLARFGGKEWKKLKYQDLTKHLEDYPTSDKKYWAEYKRFIFFNTNAVSAGNTADFYGKLKAPHLSADADLLPFSEDVDNQEYSGNQAIVLLAYAEALGSDKKKNPSQGRVEEKRGFEILDLLWKPFEEDLAMEQNMRPAFNVPNFFGPTQGEDMRGKFDY